jgi:hypothetical protein
VRHRGRPATGAFGHLADLGLREQRDVDRDLAQGNDQVAEPGG